MSDDTAGSGPEVILKPDALLALHSVTEELFDTLRRWFRVPSIVSLDLSDVDAVVREMCDPVMIAALAMRKLQALATAGTARRTHEHRRGARDRQRPRTGACPGAGDAAQAARRGDRLGRGLRVVDPRAQWPAPRRGHAPRQPRGRPRDRTLPRAAPRLHAAAIAVLEASNGEIRYLE